VYTRYDRAGQSGWPDWLASLVWRIWGCWNYRESRQRCLLHDAHEAYGAACRRTAAWESMVARQHRSMAACTGSMAVVQHCRSAARQEGSTASRHHGRHHGSMATFHPVLELDSGRQHFFLPLVLVCRQGPSWVWPCCLATCVLPVAPCQGDPLTHISAVSCPPGPAPMVGPIPTSHHPQVKLRRSQRFFL
jgi:hypothetical protein